MDLGRAPSGVEGGMVADSRYGQDSIADITERLLSAYEGIVPLSTVSAVVNGARTELSGQVPHDALPELLHRLADARLSQLAVID